MFKLWVQHAFNALDKVGDVGDIIKNGVKEGVNYASERVDGAMTSAAGGMDNINDHLNEQRYHVRQGLGLEPDNIDILTKARKYMGRVLRKP